MAPKVAEEVSKNLASLKEVLSGTGDKEPQTEAVAQLAQELYNTDLLIYLIANLQRIDFEVGRSGLGSACRNRRTGRVDICAFSLQGKKDVVHLFSNIVRRQIGARSPTVEYISAHSQILFMLLKGYVVRACLNSERSGLESRQPPV